MAEAGRITQLQMMLVQQAGPSVLPLSILAQESFLPFVRAAEQLALEQNLCPVLVYWSRHSAAKLLPGGPRYRQLMRDAFCVSIFSEERGDPPEEWCVLLESRSLSLVVYGQQALEAVESEKYQCSGSMDPQIVRQAFNRLLPIWQFIDLTEANRVEDARVNIGYSNSAPNLVQQLKAAWPVVKSPIGPNIILPGDAGLLQPEQGKINPIALNPQPGSQPGTPMPPGATPGQNVFLQYPPGVLAPPPQPTGPPAIDAAGNIKIPDTPPATFQYPTADPGAASNANQTSQTDTGSNRAGGIAGAMSNLRNQRDSLAPGETDKHSGDPRVAQGIIGDIIGQLRHSSDLFSILQFAIENLTKAAHADRGLIWQVVGDQLAVTTEYAASGHMCFQGNQLGVQESTAIVLEFLSRFPDESGAGVIPVPDTSEDETNLHKVSPTLSSLIELGEVKARLMVQLRSRGIFSGFLELQQCSSARYWSREDAMMLQSVAEMLSVVVQQSFDQSKIEMDAREMKLINEIASLFRESRGQTSQDSLVKSVMLVAEHMGFVHSQIYLFNQDEVELIPQIQNGAGDPVSLSMKENPFVSVFESGRGKVINMEYSRKGDPFFSHDMALVLPLVSEGERLGVFGLWQRQANRPQFRAQDRELGLTIAGHLSNVIRAEQAILLIRAEQARAALINKVSSEIRQSLKEVDQIMETLVQSLRDHFDLAYCVSSLFDANTMDFSKSKKAVSSEIPTPDEEANPDAPNQEYLPNIGEHLFFATLEELKQGTVIFLSAEEARLKLAQRGIGLPLYFKSATLVPLIHAGNFKASLCMISSTKDNPLPRADMNMVTDLADRVAVVVSHTELFAQVERQAVTDPMTGLFNRRYFEEQLFKEIDRYQRFGHAFAFIMVDLDFLKKINDSLGHQYGDIAIKHIANVLKRNVRDVDTVGRFGGEEFVVLLPETDMVSARMVAERICTSIREKPVEGVGTVTASLGLASFPHDAQEGEKLFELVDQAMFLAKRRGRDQVCSVSQDLLPTLGESGELASEFQERAMHPKFADFPAPPLDLGVMAEGGLLGILTEISKKIEERDLYKSDRSTRAIDYASKICKALNFAPDRTEVIALALALNNLGKINISPQILQKPGPLTPEEMDIIKNAPRTAAKFLEPAKLLNKVAPVVETYHEHWDGTGYPSGLKGEDIPMEARVVSLIDAYVAMTSDRPYRKGLSKEEVIKELQSGSGTKWDARIVKIFLRLLNQEEAIQASEPAIAPPAANESAQAEAPTNGQAAEPANGQPAEPTNGQPAGPANGQPTEPPTNGAQPVEPTVGPQPSEAAQGAQPASD
jgi:diguanylate cyclase (GGDEF)-like protein